MYEFNAHVQFEEIKTKLLNGSSTGPIFSKTYRCLNACVPPQTWISNPRRALIGVSNTPIFSVLNVIYSY
jgi:hypothetical protein